MSSPAPWVVALGLAGVVGLVVTPLATRGRRGRSRRRGRSSAWGGSSAGIAVAIVATVPFLAFGADTPVVVGVLAGLGLWSIGALVQRGHMPARLRTGSLLLASVAVVASGLRLSVTGFALGDGVVTVAILFFAANAWRSAKTRDGLLLGWTIVIAATAGWLGGLAGERATAAIAAGLVGACLALLAYWSPPTAARLRAGGSLLVGFIVVVVALDVHPTVGAPSSALIHVLLVAVPLLDGVLVASATLRHPSVDPLLTGLAGRLRAARFSRPFTTLLLISCQLVLGIVAVFAGRGVLNFGIAATVAAVIVVGLWFTALASKLPGPRGRWPVQLVLIGFGGFALVVVLAVPAALAVIRVRDTASQATAAARLGLHAAEQGDSVRAAADFGRAEALFADVHRTVSNPLTSGGLLVPVLSPNLSAVRDLSEMGVELSRAGRSLARTADPRQLRVRNGIVPLARSEKPAAIARIRGQYPGPVNRAPARYATRLPRFARHARAGHPVGSSQQGRQRIRVWPRMRPA